MRRLLRFAASSLVTALALAMAGVGAPAGCADRPPCEFNSDCVNEYCDNGTCKHDCVDSALDCPAGKVCNAIGKCAVDDGSTGGGAGTTTGTTTGSGGGATGGAGGATTTTGSGGATTTTTGTGGAPTTTTTVGGQGQGGQGPDLGHELDLCQTQADCQAPLLCKPYQRNGASRCLRACQSNGECPAGARCLDVNGAKYCAAEDAGKNCNNGTQCNFACVPGPGYCTVPCGNGSDCPNGWGCMPVGGQRVCIKAEAEADSCQPQGANKKCVVPAACDDTILVTSCTLACDSAADCPRRAAGLSPWTCDGLCRRPQEVLGPLPGGATAEYACLNGQVVNLCNDAQHMNFTTFTLPSPPQLNCPVNVSVPGAAGDECVDTCRYQGGCPYGFACNALAGVGNDRIGLCLPIGNGEVGAACTKAADCAFGYCTAANKCSRDCTDDGICPKGSACKAPDGTTVEGVAFRRCE
jgi:hypothetical protein